ncbi:VOC family protein [Halomarina rubra]|uniref:VOC family protein n=1 Tax=Halomarina rubra TaxID=2071873 RepID=A0ABD6AVQ6_9EURY|nr:VOC family protein [Halomarina rubra]
MDVRHIDHVNLRIPADGVEEALAFYVDRLGFDADRMDAFEAGEKPFFSIRLAPEHVVHLWPSEEFEPPTGTSYDHLALVVDHDVETVRARLDEAGVVVERELDAPTGATGTAPAVYARDPFGYRVELKAPTDPDDV